MTIIGKIKSSRTSSFDQDLMLEGADFFVGNSKDTNTWQSVTIEQVYKLNEVNAIQWSSFEYKKQILEHYSRLTGTPVDTSIDIEIVKPANESYITQTISTLLNNKFVKLGLFVLIAAALVAGGLSIFKWAAYSEKVSKNDVSNLVVKAQETNYNSVEKVGVFSGRYKIVMNNYKTNAFNKMVQEISADTETYLDIDAMITNVLNNPNTLKEIQSGDSSVTPQKIQAQIDELKNGKSEIGLTGTKRIIAYTIFKNYDLYFDEEIEERDYVLRTLNMVIRVMNGIEPIYTEQDFDNITIEKVENKENSFKYIGKNYYINLLVTNSREFGPRISWAELVFSESNSEK